MGGGGGGERKESEEKQLVYTMQLYFNSYCVYEGVSATYTHTVTSLQTPSLKITPCWLFCNLCHYKYHLCKFTMQAARDTLTHKHLPVLYVQPMSPIQHVHVYQPFLEPKLSDRTWKYHSLRIPSHLSVPPDQHQQ